MAENLEMATELGVTPRLRGWKCKEVGAMQGIRELACESEIAVVTFELDRRITMEPKSLKDRVRCIDVESENFSSCVVEPKTLHDSSRSRSLEIAGARQRLQERKGSKNG